MRKTNRTYSQRDRDIHSRQLDPEHDAYWKSRGEESRPSDWKERLERESQSEESSKS